MTEVTGKVVINDAGLKKFAQIVDDDMRNPSSTGPLRKAFKQWAYRYRSYLQLRFAANSRGAGDWPPLAPSTLARRRGGTAAILRDTGTLFAALSPTFAGESSGALEREVAGGIEIGFGGGGAHPSGAATIAEIASYHHFGLGSNPIRTIIVEPPSHVIAQMVNDAQRAMKEISDQTKIVPRS